MGLCIVLEVEGTKVRMWSEHGRYDVDTTRAQLVESSPASAKFPESPERLLREYDNYQRRKKTAEYDTAMLRAQEATARGDFATASAYLTKALQINPESSTHAPSAPNADA